LRPRAAIVIADGVLPILEVSMFDLEKFIAGCIAADRGGDGQKAIREILAEAVAAPGDVLKTLGEPSEAGVERLHHSDTLTIVSVIWAPLMTIMPHNHNMWACIGIYTGREYNIFWGRVGEKVEAAGAKALSAGDAEPLGKDIVHSVTNPIERLTGAIHIYGGDFFSVARSEWEPDKLTERPYDLAKNMRLFQEANARYEVGAPN
jgi:predicted metal-dependent enzyme (double-stranded beta helix superfamily)